MGSASLLWAHRCHAGGAGRTSFQELQRRRRLPNISVRFLLHDTKCNAEDRQLKLTDSDIAEIRHLVDDGFHIGAVAQVFGVTKRHVYGVTTAPPAQPDLDLVNAERERLQDEAQFADDAAGFAGFPSGDQADYMSYSSATVLPMTRRPGSGTHAVTPSGRRRPSQPGT